VAHVTGVAADLATARIPPELDLVASLSDPEQAEMRDEVTAEQVASRRNRTIADIADEWNRHLNEVLAMIRGEKPFPRPVPFADAVLVTDLAVHAQDVRNATGRQGDRDSAGVRIALASYAAALMLRLAQHGLAALRLRYDGKERLVGDGEPGATLSGDRYEIFRALAGRRTVEQMLAMDWEGDPKPYVDVLPAYEPPARPLPEA
jgi:uncharacterized protein (TIGR03083 family)